MKKLLLIFFLFLSFSMAMAQDKTDLAIEAISTTDFMIEFDSTAVEVKEYAETIKQNIEIYNEYEVDEIRKAYNKTASEYNSILIRVRDDLLDKDNLKLMSSNPNLFSDSYTLQLNKANEFCKKNLITTVNEINSSKGIDGFALGIILSILEVTLELVTTYKDHKSAIKKLNVDLLNEKFVDPHKLPSWDNL